jgi:hypothetical protein
MNSFLNEKSATSTLRAVTTWVVQPLRARNTTLRFALVLAFVPAAIHAQVALNAQFSQELEENGLKFRETALMGYTATPISANPHMNYELAVRSKKLPLEIRYAIRRWPPSFQTADDASIMLDATLLNIAKATDRKDPASGILNSVKFDTKAVRNDFNAEWGATALVIPKKEFAAGFDRCMVVYIFRKQTGAYMFYLFNDQGKETAMEEIGKIFTILQFR